MGVNCRVGCGACCIAISISSRIPEMEPVIVAGVAVGKPAGVRCVQLTSDNRCQLFGKPERPIVCSNLRPSAEMCGDTFEDAFIYLETLEAMTGPQQEAPAGKGEAN
ncbi:MAG TPA: YkgJ family cysteine cluster protein [Spirochaetia bacterium]|nr:YkgJ family cysteine cluster protein [Spirochaetia bacterium]